jgi:hypothetical protein
MTGLGVNDVKKSLVVFVIALICVGLCACGQKNVAESSATTWQEQYDLGVRYLSEGNYQEAIIAFTAAIEIDPKQAPAYVGRGDAYCGAAKNMTDDATSEYYEKAVADYKTAAELGDTSAADKLEEITLLLQQLNANEQASSLLQPLFELFSQGDIDAAKELMRQEDYRELSNTLQDGFLAFEDGVGTAVAVYPDQFYYYGQWTNGQRNGEGLWLRAAYDSDSNMESYQFTGTWENDLPNGAGKIVVNKDASKIRLETGSSTSVCTETDGSFKAGLFDGVIQETWQMNTGNVHVWNITAVDGVYQPMENIPSEVMSREYYQEKLSKGEYIVAFDENNPETDLWNDGGVHTVSGLGLNTSK